MDGLFFSSSFLPWASCSSLLLFLHIWPPEVPRDGLQGKRLEWGEGASVWLVVKARGGPRENTCLMVSAMPILTLAGPLWDKLRRARGLSYTQCPWGQGVMTQRASWGLGQSKHLPHLQSSQPASGLLFPDWCRPHIGGTHGVGVSR